ncbi:hypothetical protein BJF79_00780 [Actinomadura sp. CNU-125]|uniref:hypothetical protein n=1 Tax=Actinomadura sp. CNU-125 TaxID=1904961 RepID=UPI000961CF9F|nr:hypothetical protein [Actinomadura sp. CNU-125]OLT31743.1 hypothetical protein BJF79_00780 [Actinomadura sp. CNU-125]
MTTLEHVTADVRSIAETLREATESDSGELRLTRTFRAGYAELVRALADVVRCQPAGTGGSAEAAEAACDRAGELQRELQRPFEGTATDFPSIWDPHRELLRVSRLTLLVLSP